MNEIIEWTCHICKKLRIDDKISVFKKDISHSYNLPIGTVNQNVRYCNDNLECIEKSKTHSLLK